MSADRMTDGLKAIAKIAQTIPGEASPQDRVNEYKRVYCEAAGVPENSVKVMYDPHNGTVRVGEAPDLPERWAAWEVEA